MAGSGGLVLLVLDMLTAGEMLVFGVGFEGVAPPVRARLVWLERSRRQVTFAIVLVPMSRSPQRLHDRAPFDRPSLLPPQDGRQP